MNITLKQHEGQINDGEKVITVKHPQDMVFLDGFCVGYIAHRNGAKFCPLRHFDKDELDPILKKIGELRIKDFTPPTGAGEPPMDPDKVDAELAKAAAAENDEYEDDDDE